jgi:CRP-like cAMP-binding protein
LNAVELKRFQLLAELEDEEREAIVDVLEPVELDARVELFAAGEQSEGLCFVAEGGVRVESARVDGSALELGPGAVLGALSLVSSGARETSAETTCRSLLYVLRRSAFRRFADEAPRAACRLLEAILRDTARLGREALMLTPEAQMGSRSAVVDPTRAAD